MVDHAGDRDPPRLMPFDLATHPRAYVTVRALAQYLDVERRAIVGMIAAGSLPAVKVGRQWRVPTDGARRAFRVPHPQH